jgi:hypothetical protein
MKCQYITYQESTFPIQCCNFYKDCVLAYYSDDSGENVIIPNGEWNLIERDVFVDTMTFDERNSFEEKMRELRNLSIQIAKRSFTGTKFPILPFEVPNDENYEVFMDNLSLIKNGENPDMTMFPFFKKEEYIVFSINKIKHLNEWSKHLKDIRVKLSKKWNVELG